MYTLKPQDGYDFAALRALDKPVLITEFNFGSADRGPFWGGVTQLAKEEDRGAAYANFLKQAMAEPSIVGVHWFQYLDQPVTGRLLDGENGHFGLVGITDVPFQGFVDSVRRSNLAASTNWARKPKRPRRPARFASMKAASRAMTVKVRGRAPDTPVGMPEMVIDSVLTGSQILQGWNNVGHFLQRFPRGLRCRFRGITNSSSKRYVKRSSRVR